MIEDIVDAILHAYEKPDTDRARIALADTIAVIAAGPGYPPARRQAETLAPPGPGRIVVGLWRHSNMLEAGLAEAFLAHALELDDWLAPGLVHAGAVAIPTLLSTAWEETLRESLRLVSAGYEAGLQVGQLLGRRHYKLFHGTATIGTAVAAAITALALAPGDPGPLRAAISLSLTYAGGLWAVNQARALYKPLSPAIAVSRGILLGRAGAVQQSSIPRVEEWACRGLQGECGSPNLWGGLALNGYKFYPSCRHSHTAVEAAERLSRQARLEDILEVRVYVYEEALRVAGKRRPATVEEARFSISHLVASSLVYGRLDLEVLEHSLRDRRVRLVEERTRLLVDDKYTEMYPRAEPARVEVRTVDSTLVEEILYPRGSPRRPPSREDILEKASGLSRWLGDPRPSLLASAILGMPEHRPLHTPIEAAVDLG